MKILVFLVLIGLGIGVVGGMVGIGGGVLLIPALTGLFKFDPRKAAGISLAVLCIPVTLPGAWKYFSQGHITSRDLELAGCIAVAFATGSYLGALFQHRLDDEFLRLLFGLLLLFVAVRTLLLSSPESFHAAAGLLAVAAGWISYLVLRALGRKHLSRPDLGEEIRRSARMSPGPDEYII